MSSVKVLLKLEKIKADGQAPIYLRITKRRKTQFISLKVSVKPDEWDIKTNRVKSKHPNSGRINAMISKRIFEAQDTILEAESKNNNISGERLKDKILGVNTVSFLKYLERHIEEQKMLENIGTYQKASAVYSKLKVYIGNRDLYFSDITVSFLKNYELYLRTKLGNAVNTVSSNLRLIRKLFNDAINEELIEQQMYPFKRYRLQQEKSHKEQLDEEDVNKIINLDLDRGSRLDDHRNLFIFCCYTGFRISDLLKLQWKHWNGTNINIVMHKTNELISIKVPTKGREILNIYGLQESKLNQNRYIFPFLENGKEYSKKELFKAISSNTAYINKNLKIIAEMADLKKKNVSCHYGRRTFTCIGLSRGMSLEHVSKLLGHQNIKVTLASYASFHQDDLNSAMDIFE